ncbi:PAS domain S-box protein [Candidatus Leptofilum sp.]|uniref:PAS domain S-box protein n=1 Tax=Candidatus Leptofilum sp. TaxID=3241576 RepID=UPI003B59ADC9
MTPASILIVEDEQLVALSMRRKLESLGYTVPGTVATGEAAIEQASDIHPDLILMDIMLAGQMDGIDAASQIREKFDIPVIYLTAYSDDASIDRARLTEPFGYLLKPFEGKELQTAIEMALYKHEMERQLRAKERWLSTVLHSIGDGVITTDEQGKITFMNPVAEGLTGWTQSDAAGEPLPEVFQAVDEETLSPIANLVTRVMDSRQTVILDNGTLLIQRDGETRPIEDSAAPIKGELDEILGVVIVFHDVSERKQAEQALRQSEEKYRLLFENSPESITLLGLDGTIVDCNEATVRLRNLPREEIIGQSFIEVDSIKEEDLERFTALFSQLLEGNKIGSLTIELTGPDNEARWVEAFPALLRRDGRVDAIQVITRDITQRKLAEDEVARYQEHLEELVAERTAELENSNLQLARSNAELEQFAYVASHDLREPLRKIKSYTELLSRRYEGKLDARADKYIDYIVDGSSRMQQLITDLLMYSRLGRADLNLNLTALSAILDGVMSDLELNIQESGATITADPLPTLNVDAQQISRLLQNLLGNALKFRGDKLAQIHISAEEKDDEWLFSVSDNGIGIEPQYVDRIFLIFQRLHTRGEYPGTGMGLAICKKIVENHNGRIWATSQPKQGATFHFTLPVKQDGRLNTGMLNLNT